MVFFFGLLSNHRITNLSALASDMTFVELSMLRRLHFGASAIVMAELKSRATDTTGDCSRKLPTAEKSARLLDQEKRLLTLRGIGRSQMFSMQIFL